MNQKILNFSRETGDLICSLFWGKNLADPSGKPIEFPYPAFHLVGQVRYMGREQFVEVAERVSKMQTREKLVLGGPSGCGKRVLGVVLFCHLWHLGCPAAHARTGHSGPDATNDKLKAPEDAERVENTDTNLHGVGAMSLQKDAVNVCQIEEVGASSSSEGTNARGRHLSPDGTEAVKDGLDARKPVCLIPYQEYKLIPADVFYASLVFTFLHDPIKLESLARIGRDMEKIAEWVTDLSETIIFIIDGGGVMDKALRPILSLHISLFVTDLTEIQPPEASGRIPHICARPELSDNEYTCLVRHFGLNAVNSEMCGKCIKFLMIDNETDLHEVMDSYEDRLVAFISTLDCSQVRKFMNVISGAKSEHIVPFGASTGCVFNYGGASHVLCKHLRNVACNYLIARIHYAANNVVAAHEDVPAKLPQAPKIALTTASTAVATMGMANTPVQLQVKTCTWKFKKGKYQGSVCDVIIGFQLARTEEDMVKFAYITARDPYDKDNIFQAKLCLQAIHDNQWY
ncbi:hypothetical protein SELMODRAFT_406268 [Selaginella moellendorffii]|uniref:Uncharacterized protein n=1 Tax=Selaginella moellendorffii TaxID=88036 RepID=D8R1T8_SELML|nr:hypothetical protein SELMODRAFT_406268 [Selaginella moellendorffii]